MGDRKIIEIGGPGLGDSLSYSTLPEELTRQFGYEVWIKPPFVPWRNPEVRMLWERNPFVAGFADDDKASAFAPYENRAARSYRSWILGMENEHGCKPTSEHPRIYFAPEYRREWRGKIFADPRSSSQPFPGRVFDEYVTKLAYQMGFNSAEVIVIDSPFACGHGKDALPGNPRMMVSGLEEYAAVVNSCAVFLTVESGGHMFASAVKGDRATPHLFSLFSTFQFNDRVFRMANVDYRVAKIDNKDWYSYS